MAKVEAESGLELIDLIPKKARADLESEASRVAELSERYIELLSKNPKPAESTLARANDELVQAQHRVIGTLNVINFFDSLDKSSSFGEAESPQTTS